MPFNRFINITARFPQRFVSILTQLKTNHAPLKSYLHRFKCADSPTCDQCQSGPETVANYILFCNKYAAQRRELAKAVKGNRWESLDLSVLGNQKFLPALFKYIKGTNRFENLIGNLSLPAPL